MIQPTRIKELNSRPIRQGDCVLYWMQASQRAEYNHALEYAIVEANRLAAPLVVLFVITPAYPDANLRHYVFMLEGLAEVESKLLKRGIKWVARIGEPSEVAMEFSRNARLVVTDAGYTRLQRQWRSHIAEHSLCRVVQVESDVIVPVEAASHKEEYSAATIRPKISGVLHRYLVPLKTTKLLLNSTNLSIESIDVSDIDSVLSMTGIDRQAKPSRHFQGGSSEARKHLNQFIKSRLSRYADERNDPNKDAVSNLSAYLHFGQISPLHVALQIQKHGGSSSDTFLEELVVRRELAMNFAYYNEAYDSFNCLPDWCRKTLAKHKKDVRPYIYSQRQLEQADTHDPYWNAAQMEMIITGKMHGYMRMYWGKKILEWMKDPVEAFDTALYLNNKYELDGRDPNGFAGVAWCFGKHDRPWAERPIFGTVRYMNAAGLKRKFDADAYVARVKDIT